MRPTALRLLFCSAAPVMIAAAIPTAGAAINPTSQTRTVSCQAFASDTSGNVSDSDSDAAPDFGPFDSSVSAQAQLDTAQGNAGGIQNSQILADAITASGSAFASGESFDFDSSADGTGRSRSIVEFTLTTAMSYRLEGTIGAFDSGSAEINLRNTAGLIFDAIAFGPATEIPIDESGLLPPEDYTFDVDAMGSAFGETFSSEFAFSEYDVTLRVGVPGAGGEVPDGDDVLSGEPLRVQRLAGGDVRLIWDASCRIDDTDFAVYEGDLDDPLTLGFVECSTGDVRQYDLTPAYDRAFYLVVPTDGTTEGSYGDKSGDVERLPSLTPCLPQALGSPVCPAP